MTSTDLTAMSAESPAIAACMTDAASAGMHAARHLHSYIHMGVETRVGKWIEYVDEQSVVKAAVVAEMVEVYVGSGSRIRLLLQHCMLTTGAPRTTVPCSAMSRQRELVCAESVTVHAVHAVLFNETIVLTRL